MVERSEVLGTVKRRLLRLPVNASQVASGGGGGMPVDLVGWVVSQVGNAGIRVARRPPDDRALRAALRIAIDRVVEQADPSCQEALRQGLRECTLGGQVGELWVSAAAAATRTLPRDIGSFTGRQGELRRVRAAVADRAATGGVLGIHAINGMARPAAAELC